MPREIIAVIAAHHERGEPRFHVRELPRLRGIDDVVQSSADQWAAASTEPHLEVHVVPDVALVAERTLGPEHRIRVELDAAAWKLLEQPRSEIDGQPFD